MDAVSAKGLGTNRETLSATGSIVDSPPGSSGCGGCLGP